MDELNRSIAYFEDAIRESDEIIAECSPALQKELTEQKNYFIVALAAMHRADPKKGLQKMGKWNKTQGEILNWECSVCGFQTGEPWADPNTLGRLAFCPHCGCQMPAADIIDHRPAPENVRNLLETIHTLRNEKAALKARYDEINRYNISCTKKIDELLAEKVAAPENKPLTLEQLRQMDGEPVWIDGKDYGGWTIFKASANKQVARCPDNVNLSYYMDDYGKTWLAYARKLEQEATT